jgi:methyl-accepting chemotaxis protein
MNFSRISIKSKLLGGFSGMAAIVIVVSILALNALNTSTAGFSFYVDSTKARADVATDIRTSVDRRALAARNLVLVTTPEDAAVEKAAVLAAGDDVKSNLARLDEMMAKGNDVPEQAKQLVAEINRVEASYGPVAAAIVGLALNNQRDQAIAKMNTECRPLLAQLINATNAYASYTHAREEMLVDEFNQRATRQRDLLLIICLAAVALAMLAGTFITRSITRPIMTAVEIARTVAKGDLSRTVRVQGNDETRDLLEALKEMTERLTEIVGRVRDSSTSISGAAGEIAAGNADLSQRTEEQAASLEETAASMEQLSSTVKQNAENAKHGSALASNASEVAQKGSEVVIQVVHTMQGISESSNKIADITGIIEGIAFQTNILALNAAVEAARAGEDGRGFAVVASEVRSLAQRSSAASKEIKELIAASVQKIQDGSALASKAGQTMQEATQAVARVTGIMSEIAAASDEQSRGVDQVNTAIGQMDEVTQQNAALVEEAAAASQSLDDQGRQLGEAMAFFHLGETLDRPLTRQERKAPAPVPKSSTVRRTSVATPVRRPLLAKAALVTPDGASWETF